MDTELRKLGKYELQELLGRGRMTEVWKAVDSQLKRSVAIKLLHPDVQVDPHFVTSFAREARLIASLHHPNIMQIHDFQITQPPESVSTMAYMVMDYIEGETLVDYIHRTSHAGRLPPAAEIVYLFAALASAIDYAHQHGMIHRDLKPANILLDKRLSAAKLHVQSPMSEPVLTDFGIAKLLGTSTGSTSDLWLETPLYTAPEQIQGSPGNELSDIYSLGAILYETCTGVPPFQGDNATAIMMQHIKSVPRSPTLINRNLPPSVSMVILRCLAKDPSARFQSASSMVAAFAEALNFPVPENLVPPTYPPDVHNEPTRYQSLPPPQLRSGAPVMVSPSLYPPNAVSTPPFARSSNSRPELPIASTPRMIQSSLAKSASSSSSGAVNEFAFVAPPKTPTRQKQSTVPSASPMLVPSSSSTPGKKRRGPLLVLLVALIIAIVGGGLGAFFLSQRHTPILKAGPPGGYAFFSSSGQLNEGNNNGIEDELRVVLQNIPDPAPGKNYYAWLLNDAKNKTIASILLGRLSVNQGSVSLTYRDPHYANLLTFGSRFLITEDSRPIAPSTNPRTWRYYAAFPEIPEASSGPAAVRTALVHLRNLLADGLTISVQYGIRGGLDIQLLRNTLKVLEWASSARDASDAEFIRRQVVRILAYLDGTPPLNGVPLVRLDVPANTPLGVDSKLAQVPLIEIVNNQKAQDLLQSYLTRIDVQLTRFSHAPGVTAEMSKSALEIDRALVQLQKWLSKVRSDAKLLIKMTDKQLLQPETRLILEDMQDQANYAIIGLFNPSTNAVLPGVIQIHYGIQRLATFVIQPYKAHS